MIRHFRHAPSVHALDTRAGTRYAAHAERDAILRLAARTFPGWLASKQLCPRDCASQRAFFLRSLPDNAIGNRSQSNVTADPGKSSGPKLQPRRAFKRAHGLPFRPGLESELYTVMLRSPPFVTLRRFPLRPFPAERPTPHPSASRPGMDSPTARKAPCAAGKRIPDCGLRLHLRQSPPLLPRQGGRLLRDSTTVLCSWASTVAGPSGRAFRKPGFVRGGGFAETFPAVRVYPSHVPRAPAGTRTAPP